MIFCRNAESIFEGVRGRFVERTHEQFCGNIYGEIYEETHGRFSEGIREEICRESSKANAKRNSRDSEDFLTELKKPLKIIR